MDDEASGLVLATNALLAALIAEISDAKLLSRERIRNAHERALRGLENDLPHDPTTAVARQIVQGMMAARFPSGSSESLATNTSGIGLPFFLGLSLARNRRRGRGTFCPTPSARPSRGETLVHPFRESTIQLF